LEAEGRDFEVDDILAFIQSPTILTSKNVASALNTVAWQSSVSAIRDMSDIDTWLKNPDIISMSSTTIAHELEMELKRLRPLWDALRAKEESVSLNGDGGGRSWDRKRSAREYDQCRQVISILGRVLKRRLRAAGMASSLNTLYALVSEWKWADLPTAIREVMDAADEFAFNESGSVAGSPSPRAEGDSKPVVEGNNPEAPSKPPAPERSDAPDASGLVLSPLDLSAYRPAMKLVVDFPNIVPDLKELNQILTKHPEIRRYKPRDNRLSVHLVDWQKFVDTFHPTSDGWDENPQNNKIRADQIRKNREGK
jgi:hypothetical protein